jgi:hypothetical protein
LVVGDRLFTVSDFGARASALDTLADRGWVAFPLPPASPGPIPMPMLRPEPLSPQPQPLAPPQPR